MKANHYTFTTRQFAKLVTLVWRLGLRAGSIPRNCSEFRNLVEKTYQIKEEPFKHLK